MSAAPELNLTDFEAMKTTDDLIIIDFWAVWCGPCKVMSPVFDKLSGDPEFQHLKFFKVNVDEKPELAELFGVQGIPSFPIIKFSKDGNFSIEKNLVKMLVGAQEPLTFRQKILDSIQDFATSVAVEDELKAEAMDASA